MTISSISYTSRSASPSPLRKLSPSKAYSIGSPSSFHMIAAIEPQNTIAGSIPPPPLLKMACWITWPALEASGIRKKGSVALVKKRNTGAFESTAPSLSPLSQASTIPRNVPSISMKAASHNAMLIMLKRSCLRTSYPRPFSTAKVACASGGASYPRLSQNLIIPTFSAPRVPKNSPARKPVTMLAAPSTESM